MARDLHDVRDARTGAGPEIRGECRPAGQRARDRCDLPADLGDPDRHRVVRTGAGIQAAAGGGADDGGTAGTAGAPRARRVRAGADRRHRVRGAGAAAAPDRHAAARGWRRAAGRPGPGGMVRPCSGPPVRAGGEAGSAAARRADHRPDHGLGRPHRRSASGRPGRGDHQGRGLPVSGLVARHRPARLVHRGTEIREDPLVPVDEPQQAGCDAGSDAIRTGWRC